MFEVFCLHTCDTRKKVRWITVANTQRNTLVNTLVFFAALPIAIYLRLFRLSEA